MTKAQKQKLLCDTITLLLASCKRPQQEVASVTVEWQELWNDNIKERDLGVERQLLPKVTLTFNT